MVDHIFKGAVVRFASNSLPRQTGAWYRPRAPARLLVTYFLFMSTPLQAEPLPEKLPEFARVVKLPKHIWDQFQVADTCLPKNTPIKSDALVTCKINISAEVPYIATAACGKFKTPPDAKIMISVEIFGGGTVKNAKIIESNISDPWFLLRLIENTLALKFPSIKEDSTFEKLEVNLNLREVSSRVKIYGCKDNYTGGEM